MKQTSNKSAYKKITTLFIIAALVLSVFMFAACTPKEIEVSGVELSAAQVQLEIGQELTLVATVLPEDATNKTVTWKSSDEETATVTGGVVKAKKSGTAVISATVGSHTATCIVTVGEGAEQGKDPSGQGKDPSGGGDDKPSTAKATAAFVSGALECYIDEFDFDSYALTVSFDNGQVKILKAKDYIKDEDKEKLTAAGTHNLGFKYESVECSFTLTLKNHLFAEAELTSAVYYYDGEAKSLAVVGAPEGTAVSYTGNAQTEVGVYEVTATLEKQYYETKTLTATLTVEKSSYALSFVMNIEGAVNPNPSVYSVQSGLTLELPWHTSFAFDGWYTDAACTDKAEKIEAYEKGDKTFYAKWTDPFIVDGNEIKGLTERAKLAMKEIVVPAEINGVKIESIGRYAFQGTFAKITLSEGIERIGASAFGSCSSLRSVVLPSTLTEMGNYVFGNCDALESIDIPGGVGVINNSTFYSCDNLKTVKIGEGVTIIGKEAFYSCPKLSAVEFPESLVTRTEAR